MGKPSGARAGQAAVNSSLICLPNAEAALATSPIKNNLQAFTIFTLSLNITNNAIYTKKFTNLDFAVFVSCDETCTMELGKVIKRLREGRGWSQDELAFRTGTSAANISRIENGKHGAGEALLEALSREFDFKVYQLVALAEGVEDPIIPVNSHPDEEALLSDFRAMTSEQQVLFRAIGGEFVRIMPPKSGKTANS